jgi:hypothetical protein
MSERVRDAPSQRSDRVRHIPLWTHCGSRGVADGRERQPPGPSLPLLAPTGPGRPFGDQEPKEAMDKAAWCWKPRQPRRS